MVGRISRLAGGTGETAPDQIRWRYSDGREAGSGKSSTSAAVWRLGPCEMFRTITWGSPKEYNKAPQVVRDGRFRRRPTASLQKRNELNEGSLWPIYYIKE